MKKLLLFFLLSPFYSFSQVVSDGTIKTNTNTLIRNATTVTRANHALINDELTDSKMSRIEANATSGTNTYTTTIPWVNSYSFGLNFPVVFNTANTGASTLNINTLGAVPLKKHVSTTLAIGDITNGQVFWVFYDGSNFQLTGGGSSTFGNLTDGPGALLSNGLNYFRVNSGGTALEYRTPSQVLADIGGGSYYQTIQNSGSALTQRLTFNFTNGLTATDNSGSGRTDIKLGSGTLGSNITLDGFIDFNLGLNTPLSRVRSFVGDAAFTQFSKIDQRNNSLIISTLSPSTPNSPGVVFDLNGGVFSGAASSFKLGVDNSTQTYFIDNRTGANRVGLQEFADYSSTRAALSYITMGHSDVRYLGISSSAASVANALTVDNSSLQLNSGTTFDGSAARTISVKNLGITNGMLAGSIAASKLIGTDITTVGTLSAGSIPLSLVTGLSTVGNNIAISTNPSAITFLRANADNSVTWLSASGFRTAIGAGTGSGDALVANPLSQFASTTSAQLRGVLSDELGTGAALFDGATPTSLVGTNITGTASGLTAGNVTTNANLTGPITSVGNATSIASQTGTGTTFMMSASPSYAGTATYGTLGYSDTDIAFSFQKNVNSYFQIPIQNTNSGATASVDFILNNDISTASTHYGDLGMNSSGFIGSGSLNLASAVYLYSNDDDLVFATKANKSIHLVTNNSTTDAMSIAGNGAMTMAATWTATSNNQYGLTATHTATSRATASDLIGGYNFIANVIAGSTSIDAQGFNIDSYLVAQGGISTTNSGSNFESRTLAGMTANTYTNISPSGTSGNGSGALFTLVISGATTVGAVTATTAGSGYRVGETITFNGNLFGSGSGSVVYAIISVVGSSLNTTASSLVIINRQAERIGTGLNKKRYLDFRKSDATTSIFSIESDGTTNTLLNFNDVSGAFLTLSSTTFNIGSRSLTTSGSVSTTSNGALSIAGTSSLTGAVTTSGGITNSTGSIINSSAVGNFSSSNSNQFLYKAGSTVVTVGVPNTTSLAGGGTGYSVVNNVTTTGGTGAGFKINILTVSSGVIATYSINARGSGYSSSDVVTVTGGGVNATITINTVDFSGDFVAQFGDVASYTDSKSLINYVSFYSNPTFNITSTQAGVTAFGYYNPTYTNLGSFAKGGLVIVPTGTLSAIGSSTLDATLKLVGSGSVPTFKTVDVGTGTNYSHVAYQSDGTTIIQFLKGNGDFQVGLAASKLGFYGTTAIVKPSGDVATALSNLGLITSPTITSTTDGLNFNLDYFTPATGGTVNLTNKKYNIINPAGALVSLTVNLPSSPSDGDCVIMKFTQAITTVTYGNGTVADGITAPTAGGLVILTYRSTGTTWY